MSDHEYLVFVEEEDDGDDERLVLHVGGRARALGDLEIQPEIDIEVANRGSNMATIGLALAFLGTLAGLTALVLFATQYPQDWRLVDGSFTSAPFFTALIGCIAGVVLVTGAILTPLGRRIEARGVLRNVRIVEKPE